MIRDPEVVAELGGARRDENWRFVTFLKHVARRGPARLDALAVRIAREATAAMDCTTCGACCRDNCIPVSDDEVSRLASCLSLPVVEFRVNHLGTDDEGQPAIEATPCPFLIDSRCGVYDDRPEPCRGYPYLGGSLLADAAGVVERAEVCPIVYETLERLKDELGFRHVERAD